MYTFCYKVLSPGGKYRTDFRHFRYLIVDIRYFSVLWIPTSVSVFQNIGYRFGISVYRPKTNMQARRKQFHIGPANPFHFPPLPNLPFLPILRSSPADKRFWVHFGLKTALPVIEVWRVFLWNKMLIINDRVHFMFSTVEVCERTHNHWLNYWSSSCRVCRTCRAFSNAKFS